MSPGLRMHMHDSARDLRSWGLVAFLSVLGCSSGATVEVAPGGHPRLAAIERLRIVEARSSTAGGAESDLSGELSRRLGGKLAPVAVTSSSDPAPAPAATPAGVASEARVVYRRADYFENYALHQSHERWYWWGLVLDPEDRTVATLHGELIKESGDPEAQFAREMRRLLRTARRQASRAATAPAGETD